MKRNSRSVAVERKELSSFDCFRLASTLISTATRRVRPGAIVSATGVTMKTVYMTALAATIIAISTTSAQEERFEGPPRGHRPPPPVIVALDANEDGMLDANEIANASTALRSIDLNGNGQIDNDEMHPPCPHCGHRGSGGGEPPSRRQRPN
jgi:hypothetical protein